jgi:Ca2+-binding RTX toxin-like protein
MSAARFWMGTAKTDHFIFESDLDTFDFVKAGAGHDVIADGHNDGYWSSDTFFGQGGNDTLISRDGDDLLFGGAGNDMIKVRAGWYDPAEMQFPSQSEHAVIGFDVKVFGGRGHDTLLIRHSEGATVEHDGDTTVIHTAYGGTITAHGIEDFQLL